MGLKHVLLGAVLASLAATADAAPRAKTRFDGIRDCERLAAVQFKRHNPAFRRFTVDRSKVTVDRFSDRVGNNSRRKCPRNNPMPTYTNPVSISTQAD